MEVERKRDRKSVRVQIFRSYFLKKQKSRKKTRERKGKKSRRNNKESIGNKKKWFEGEVRIRRDYG